MKNINRNKLLRCLTSLTMVASVATTAIVVSCGDDEEASTFKIVLGERPETINGYQTDSSHVGTAEVNLAQMLAYDGTNSYKEVGGKKVYEKTQKVVDFIADMRAGVTKKIVDGDKTVTVGENQDFKDVMEKVGKYFPSVMEKAPTGLVDTGIITFDSSEFRNLVKPGEKFLTPTDLMAPPAGTEWVAYSEEVLLNSSGGTKVDFEPIDTIYRPAVSSQFDKLEYNFKFKLRALPGLRVFNDTEYDIKIKYKGDVPFRPTAFARENIIVTRPQVFGGKATISVDAEYMEDNQEYNVVKIVDGEVSGILSKLNTSVEVDPGKYLISPILPSENSILMPGTWKDYTLNVGIFQVMSPLLGAGDFTSTESLLLEGEGEFTYVGSNLLTDLKIVAYKKSDSNSERALGEFTNTSKSLSLPLGEYAFRFEAAVEGIEVSYEDANGDAIPNLEDEITLDLGLANLTNIINRINSEFVFENLVLPSAPGWQTTAEIQFHGSATDPDELSYASSFTFVNWANNPFNQAAQLTFKASSTDMGGADTQAEYSNLVRGDETWSGVLAGNPGGVSAFKENRIYTLTLEAKADGLFVGSFNPLEIKFTVDYNGATDANDFTITKVV